METCIQRVDSRSPDRNLENTLESTRKLFGYWTQEIAVLYPFDLEIPNGDSPGEDPIDPLSQRIPYGAL